MGTIRRKSATPIDVLRARLHAFLTFLKPRLIEMEADLDRLSALRRLSDVRVRQFSVGKSRITGLDLCGLLADPRTGRFDSVAEGVLRPGHLTQALAPLSEELGYVVETCLILQTIGPEKLGVLVRDFVRAQGPAPEGPAAAAKPAVPAPLPPPIAAALGAVRELWAAPAPVIRTLQLLAAADSLPSAVAAELQKNPAIGALVVRLAAQTPSGQASRPSSIMTALVAVGYPVLRRVVSAAALLAPLGIPPSSLRTAHAAALIARASNLGSPDEHFFAGLLQDVGAIAIAKHRPGADVDAALAGACILERWRFPAGCVEAARHRDATPERFEDIQIPREALVAVGARHLDERWAPLLRLSPARLKEISVQADGAVGAFS